MRDLGFQVGRQVDDVNSVERTFLRANTATDTKSFRDESDLGLWSDLDTEFAGTDHRTGLFAFLAAFLKTSVRAPATIFPFFFITLGLHCLGRRCC